MRRSKYNAKPTVVDGVRFASQAEAKRDAELQLLQRNGNITGLRRQPRFPLKVNGIKICTYIGDWSYYDHDTRNGNVRSACPMCVVEDRKGVLTPAFKLKWALAKALYPDIEWRLS